MLAEVKRDGAHVAFRDLIDNDGRYQVHAARRARRTNWR